MNNTTSTQNNKPHFAGELIDRITVNARDKAMREYLGGEVHRAYRCINICTDLLKTYDEALKNGTLNPHFENYCGRNQFTKVLTVSPKVTYLGCEGYMNDWTEDNKLSQSHPELVDTAKAELTDDQFAKLSALSDNDLLRELDRINLACEATFVHVHTEDDAARKTYYKELIAFLRTAAAYAKSIGSLSAKMFLHVLAIILPPGAVGGREGYLDATYDEASIASAYDIAAKAHRQLWVDIEFGKIGG